MRKNYRAKPKITLVKHYRSNEQILAPEVRAIDEEGGNLGVLPTKQALALAQERGQDIIEVEPNAVPPVVKFMNRGKFRYMLEKQAKIAKARSKKIEIKGVRLSLRIGSHDRSMRMAQAKAFLGDGDKVKVEIVLKGRENQMAEEAKSIIANFLAELGTAVALTVEQEVAKQGNKISTIVLPKK